MGVDTKIHILLQDNNVQITVDEIRKIISKKLPVLGDITTELSHRPDKYDKDASCEIRENQRLSMYETWNIYFALDYPADQFESKKEQRRMFCYYDHYEQGSMLYLSMGSWGHNEDIAKCLVDAFGGYADFNDCDDISIDYAQPQPKVKQLF